MLYFLCCFILSCSSEEELIEEVSIDPIVGKWHYYSYTMADEETIYNECKQKGYFLFNKDGTGENTPYWERDLNCYRDFSKKITWSLDNSTYLIKIYSQGGYGGVLSFPIIYQYYGEISNDYLKIPVGNNETTNFVKRNN